MNKKTIKNFEEALEHIFTFEITKDYSLKKVNKAIILLNNPLKNIKIIHIAWTNWKWSVSKMVFSILKENNKSVWIFTSPHLVDIRERAEINHWIISKELFVKYLNKIINLELELSYFEKCMLISFLYFEEKKVEYAIIETWVWWLLDSTNIVNPIITAITSIWLDHTKLLWNDLDKITYQKAWIIKPNIPIVYNHKNNIIKYTAEKNNSQIIYANRKIKTNLLWDYQENNAAIAYEIWKYLLVSLVNSTSLLSLIKISKNINKEKALIKEKILSWLQKVKHRWRLDFIKENVLIDWAHNADWLESLKKFINLNLNKKYKKIYYCFAMKKWKDINLILDIFNLKNKDYILINSKNKIVENMSKYSESFLVKDKDYILKESIKNKGTLYVVFWSLYMIWEFY